MLRLGLPEVAGGTDLSHHLAGPQARRLDIGDGVERDLLLVVVDIEDGRTVAGTDVVALPVLRCRIMNLEKESSSVR